ncbi:hypothetical protein DL89DRAFT_73782 [Linderina pennispora]|uniref:Uncharacterized protein n=1 Tax=Linderina pennispora TaxID=61395 RepID=A0A1Y1VRK3_9FUNG|nr:uncharacterized protein DL89DRAFT_73782 [Linderina pennispora]ORX63656.1 hypothetical protein DL89DRAFT_73782 [Linderina pennispora]
MWLSAACKSCAAVLYSLRKPRMALNRLDLRIQHQIQHLQHELPHCLASLLYHIALLISHSITANTYGDLDQRISAECDSGLSRA